MTPSQAQLTAFRARIWDYYHDHARDLPWRRDPTPYQVFISEVMLQQTQVSRVLTKYAQWLQRFPDFNALAATTVADVLAAWQGLGYNRRALWLQRAAEAIVRDHAGRLPRDPAALITLPGIGPGTAGSLAAFAYNEPTVFIETNIRRVFIHEFFPETVPPGGASGSTSAQGGGVASAASRVRYPESGSVGDELRGSTVMGVKTVEISARAQLPRQIPDAAIVADPITDAQLMPLIAATLDRTTPREWYYALMDYGAELARRVPNPNRRSHHYTVQSRFEGSLRQLRGAVLRQLLAGPATTTQLAAALADPRLPAALHQLEHEGFLVLRRRRYRLPS